MSALFKKLVQLVTASPVRRNVGMTLARQITAAGTQLLVVILVARQLGPEGNGFYSMAILLPTLLANFLSLGVAPATVYYISRKQFTVGLALNENLKLAAWISVSGLLIAVPAIIFWGANLFPGIPKALLYIALASFPISLSLALISSILQGIEDFKAFNVTVLLPPVITLIGAALSFFVFDAGIRGVLVSYILGQAVALFSVFVFLRRSSFTVFRSDFSTYTESADYRSRVLNYGWKAHLSNIITFINYRADVVLVNFFISPAATGLYMVAVQISEKLWMPSQAVSTVLLPRLSSMTHDPEARSALTKKGFWLVASITALASLVAAIALYFFIGPIFGNEYREALPALVCLIPGIVLWAGARVQANCIAAAGKPEWNMYISIGVLAINLTGNIILVPVWGIIGAAVATSTAYTVDAFAKSILVRRTTTLSIV